MFAKTYRYRIAAADFRRWHEITQAAKDIYAFHGLSRTERLVRTVDEATLEILECVFAPSREAFARSSVRIDADERVQVLFKSFLALVQDGEIVQEEWEGY